MTKSAEANKCAPRWLAGAAIALLIACQQTGASQDTEGALLVCRGTATECALLSSTDCVSAQGCAAGSCTGMATPCSRRATSTACILQPGCAFDDMSQVCTGVARACPSYVTAASCRGSDGCAWSEGCSGKSAACDALSPAACAAQPGCALATNTGDAATPGREAATACTDAAASGEIIDDMEEPSALITSTTTYGSWYVYNDGTTAGRQRPAPGETITMEPIPEGRCASQSAMRMTGTGFSDWGAGMGFNFGTGMQMPGDEYPPALPIDGSAYEGIRFWARVGSATTNKVRFSILDNNTHPDGHVCTMPPTHEEQPSDAGAQSIDASMEQAVATEGPSSDATAAVDASAEIDADAPAAVDASAEIDADASRDVVVNERPAPTALSTAECYNGWRKELVLSTEWVEYRISFAELQQQPGWGFHAPALVRGQIYAVHFDVPQATTFDVWIDDIAWYRAGEP